MNDEPRNIDETAAMYDEGEAAIRFCEVNNVPLHPLPPDDVLPLGRAFIIWAVVLVWGLVAMFVLGNVQSSGAAPEYTCAPGEVYTTAECP